MDGQANETRYVIHLGDIEVKLTIYRGETAEDIEERLAAIISAMREKPKRIISKDN